MAERYPAIEPYETGTLDVDNGHVLYWEAVGNPVGTPAVYLHGGPDSGCIPGARRNFDPGTYRVVLFDQRGCGRSRPLASELDADLSTTDHLVADLERLREHLEVEWWVVVGVSQGVTLGMVLGAVTSGSRRETEWITRDMGRVFPREWECFAAVVPKAERGGDLAAAYARLLRVSQEHERAALAWCQWEDVHVFLMPRWEPSLRYEDPQFRLVFASIVTHYWSHGCFLADGGVLVGVRRLAGIPQVLIHGCWDVSSPLDTAWALHRVWLGSQLVVLDDAGHGGAGFPEAMTAALDGFRELD